MRAALSHIVVVALMAIAVACGSTTQSVDMHDMERSRWSSAEEFYYDNADSLAERNIAVVVRYDRGYVADSVAMSILTISPDSLVVEEHITLSIPQIEEVRPTEQIFPYRSGVVLRQKGQYTFRLTPDQSVEGIQSIGIAISEPEGQ